MDDGVDTRSYGSNEHNMGRAAHNQNMLMRAQKVAMRLRIGLVACCGQKLKGSHRAADIYQSALFKKSRAYVEKNCDMWVVLSAKHGVLWPDDVIQDYDETLNDMPSDRRATWSKMVRGQLSGFSGDKMIVLAGNRYCEWTGGFDVERPMAGKGIGQQIQWLTEEVNIDDRNQRILI